MIVLDTAVDLVQITVGRDTRVAIQQGALVDVVGEQALILAGVLEALILW